MKGEPRANGRAQRHRRTWLEVYGVVSVPAAVEFSIAELGTCDNMENAIITDCNAFVC